VAGSCECGNKPSVCVKCEDLLASEEGICSTECFSNLPVALSSDRCCCLY
jgi:hypothetical protein